MCGGQASARSTYHVCELHNVLCADGGLLMVVLNVDIDDMGNLVVLRLSVFQVCTVVGTTRFTFSSVVSKNTQEAHRRWHSLTRDTVPRTTSSKMRLSQVMMT